MKLSAMFTTRFQNTSRGDEFGFTSRVDDKGKRVINKDGTFNVKKIGEKQSVFHNLLTMKAWQFALRILFIYSGVNIFFAIMYILVDINGIGATENFEIKNHFFIALFFSAQTLTTVGYGSLYPLSGPASFLAATEALIGLMMFAIFTGLMYGRFSKPIPGIRFSKNALISPFREGNALMFRVANEMNNNLLELEARAIISVVLYKDGKESRTYEPLELKNSKITYFPLNWTLVHILDEKSPLAGMNEQDYKAANLEIMIMIKGYNETYAQEIHARSSYMYEEVLWNKKFTVPYYFDTAGVTIFELEKLDVFEEAAVASSPSS